MELYRKKINVKEEKRQRITEVIRKKEASNEKRLGAYFTHSYGCRMPNCWIIRIRGGKPMIQKLLCWLFGHKTLYKAATGHILTVDTHFERDMKLPLVKWERSKFCLLEGEEVKPCPFCGSGMIELENTHSAAYWMECQGCGAQVDGESFTNHPDNEESHLAAAQSARTAWNRRVSV